MNGHIAKPISVDVILENLERIFGDKNEEENTCEKHIK